MADTEVESILSEIRERVRATHVAQNAGTASAPEPLPTELTFQSDEPNSRLSLIDSYLTTTARAWDRLPPVVTNRIGMSARVELWLKKHLKRATRWYAWEQVNFNAAVHHALRDLLPVVSAQQEEIRRLQLETVKQTELVQSSVGDLQNQLVELQKELAELRKELDIQQRAADERSAELQNELQNELRQRDDRLLQEQRVCFKQLSLENSEAAVLEDRGRRKTAEMIEELQRRLSELENNHK